MQGPLNLRACVAELVGTFLFFAIGFMAVQAIGALQAPVLVIVPFAFGLACWPPSPRSARSPAATSIRL